MSATDYAYLEVVDKNIIKRAYSTDNLNYSILLYGTDLPIMDINDLLLIAINAGGFDTNLSLKLTVTATPGVIPAYSLREAIRIPDEVGLVIKLLKTSAINHRLKHIIPYENIHKEQPAQWKDLPGMYIRKVSNVSMVRKENLGEDYETGVEKIGHVWQCDILFDLVAHVKTIFNYPPIETDGEDSANRYEHAKNCLPVMHQLLHTILMENRSYTDPDGSTLEWDFIEPGEYQLIDGGYAGARDVWAIQCLYTFQFEMEVE
jgi:hypothetical protein